MESLRNMYGEIQSRHRVSLRGMAEGIPPGNLGLQVAHAVPFSDMTPAERALLVYARRLRGRRSDFDPRVPVVGHAVAEVAIDVSLILYDPETDGSFPISNNIADALKKAIAKREQPANAEVFKEPIGFDPAEMYRTVVEVYRERAQPRGVGRDLEGLVEYHGMFTGPLAKMHGHKLLPSMYLIDPRGLSVVGQVNLRRS